MSLQVGGTRAAGAQEDRETKTLFSCQQAQKSGKLGVVCGDRNGVWMGPRSFRKQVELTLLSAAFPNAYATSTLLFEEL